MPFSKKNRNENSLSSITANNMVALPCNKWNKKIVNQLFTVYYLLDLPDASCCTNMLRHTFRDFIAKGYEHVINDI